jgi:hypothetical protein
MCGALVLTAVPAKAEFRSSEWFTPKVALVTAGVLAACWLVKKCFFGQVTIRSAADLPLLKNLKTGNTFHVQQRIEVKPHAIRVTGNQPGITLEAGKLEAGTYEIFETCSGNLDPHGNFIGFMPKSSQPINTDYTVEFMNDGSVLIEKRVIKRGKI